MYEKKVSCKYSTSVQYSALHTALSLPFMVKNIYLKMLFRHQKKQIWVTRKVLKNLSFYKRPQFPDSRDIVPDRHVCHCPVRIIKSSSFDKTDFFRLSCTSGHELFPKKGNDTQWGPNSWKHWSLNTVVFSSFFCKEISRVIDWLREMKNAHQWELEENSWRWNNMYRVNDSGPT